MAGDGENEDNNVKESSLGENDLAGEEIGARNRPAPAINQPSEAVEGGFEEYNLSGDDLAGEEIETRTETKTDIVIPGAVVEKIEAKTEATLVADDSVETGMETEAEAALAINVLGNAVGEDFEEYNISEDDSAETEIEAEAGAAPVIDKLSTSVEEDSLDDEDDPVETEIEAEAETAPVINNSTEKEIEAEVRKKEEEISKLVEETVRTYGTLFCKPVWHWTNFEKQYSKSSVSTLDTISQMVDFFTESNEFRNTDPKNIDTLMVDRAFKKSFASTGKEFSGNYSEAAKAEVVSFLKLLRSIEIEYNLTPDVAKAFVFHTILTKKEPPATGKGKSSEEEKLLLYRVGSGTAPGKIKDRILRKATRNMLENTTNSNNAGELNELSKHIDCMNLARIMLKQSETIRHIKASCPAIGHSFDVMPGDEASEKSDVKPKFVPPTLTTDGRIITGLTRDQATAFAELGRSLRDSGKKDRPLAEPLAINMLPGEGKSYLTDTLFPRYLKGTIGEPLTLSNGSKSEMSSFDRSGEMLRETKYINLTFANLYGGIDRKGAEKAIAAEFNRKLASQSKIPPPILSFDESGNPKISGGKLIKNIVLVVDEYYQMPDPVFGIVNKLSRGLKAGGTGVQMVTVGATPNGYVLEKEAEYGINGENGKKALAKHRECEKQFSKSLKKDLHILGSRLEDGECLKHRVGLINEENIFKDIKGDLSGEATNVQLILPDVYPEDLEAIVKKLDGDGIIDSIQTVLFRDAKNNVVCYRRDQEGILRTSGAPDLSTCNPLEDGKVLTLYSKGNYVGGDFGAHSASAIGRKFQQLVYSKKSLSLAAINQIASRFRHDNMTELDANMDMVIRTGKLFLDVEEFMKDAESCGLEDEIRKGTNYFKNRVALRMMERGFKEDSIKKIFEFIKLGGSVAELNMLENGEIVKLLGAYETSLKNEEALGLGRNNPKLAKAERDAEPVEESDEKKKEKIAIKNSLVENIRGLKAERRALILEEIGDRKLWRFDIYREPELVRKAKAIENKVYKDILTTEKEYGLISEEKKKIEEEILEKERKMLESTQKLKGSEVEAVLGALDNLRDRINHIMASHPNSGSNKQLKALYKNFYSLLAGQYDAGGKLIINNKFRIVNIPSCIERVAGITKQELTYTIAHGGISSNGNPDELKEWQRMSALDQWGTMNRCNHFKPLKNLLALVDGLREKVGEKKIGMLLGKKPQKARTVEDLEGSLTSIEKQMGSGVKISSGTDRFKKPSAAAPTGSAEKPKVPDAAREVVERIRKDLERVKSHGEALDKIRWKALKANMIEDYDENIDKRRIELANLREEIAQDGKLREKRDEPSMIWGGDLAENSMRMSISNPRPMFHRDLKISYKNIELESQKFRNKILSILDPTRKNSMKNIATVENDIVRIAGKNRELAGTAESRDTINSWLKEKRDNVKSEASEPGSPGNGKEKNAVAGDIDRIVTDVEKIAQTEVSKFRVMFREPITGVMNPQAVEYSTIDIMDRLASALVSDIARDSSQAIDNNYIKEKFRSLKLVSSVGGKNRPVEIGEGNTAKRFVTDVAEFCKLVVNIAKTHRISPVEAKALLMGSVFEQNLYSVPTLGKLGAGKAKPEEIKSLIRSEVEKVDKNGKIAILENMMALPGGKEGQKDPEKSAELEKLADKMTLRGLIKNRLEHNRKIDSIASEDLREKCKKCEPLLLANGKILGGLSEEERKLASEIDNRIGKLSAKSAKKEVANPIFTPLPHGDGSKFVLENIKNAYLGGGEPTIDGNIKDFIESISFDRPIYESTDFLENIKKNDNFMVESLGGYAKHLLALDDVGVLEGKSNKIQMLLPFMDSESLQKLVSSREFQNTLRSKNIDNLLYRYGKNVVLLRLDPKTKAYGISIVDPGELEEKGRELLAGSNSITIYSQENCRDGDFKGFSENVSRQIIYSPEVPDAVLLEALETRNRRTAKEPDGTTLLRFGGNAADLEDGDASDLKQKFLGQVKEKKAGNATTLNYHRDRILQEFKIFAGGLGMEDKARKQFEGHVERGDVEAATTILKTIENPNKYKVLKLKKYLEDYKSFVNELGENKNLVIFQGDIGRQNSKLSSVEETRRIFNAMAAKNTPEQPSLKKHAEKLADLETNVKDKIKKIKNIERLRLNRQTLDKLKAINPSPPRDAGTVEMEPENTIAREAGILSSLIGTAHITASENPDGNKSAIGAREKSTRLVMKVLKDGAKTEPSASKSENAEKKDAEKKDRPTFVVHQMSKIKISKQQTDKPTTIENAVQPSVVPVKPMGYKEIHGGNKTIRT
ncbi:MAG: hypothetical protein LBU15_03845 [Rickettsiales bacterium]|jgi:hypothetical protein|nr:hypothetical protein [Rickettsiales bacterium]